MDNTASFYLANVGSIPAGRAININMNILIIGDSWGVPNYPPYDLNLQHYGDPPETHTEFLLRAQGYTVTNCSINASGNLKTILAGIKYAETEPVDWIIWFHTEMLRDSYFNDFDKKNYRISELIESIAEIVYKKFHELRSITGARSIVIGGQAPVLDLFHRYSSTEFIKSDWRSEILDRQLPVVHSLCANHLLDNDFCIDSIKDKIQLLDQHKLILDAMDQSEDFPDRCHPGRDPHRKLVEWILKIFENRIHPVN